MAPPNDLQVGDVVQLKSGGPLLTVDTVNSNDMVDCIWFNMDQNGRYTTIGRQTFRCAVLTKSTSGATLVKNSSLIRPLIDGD